MEEKLSVTTILIVSETRLDRKKRIWLYQDTIHTLKQLTQLIKVCTGSDPGEKQTPKYSPLKRDMGIRRLSGIPKQIEHKSNLIRPRLNVNVHSSLMNNEI